MKKYLQPLLVWLIISVSFLNACKPSQDMPGEPTPSTAISTEIKVAIPPYIPDALNNMLNAIQSVVLSAPSDGVGVRLDVSAEEPAFNWVYVVAAPFSYIGDGVTGSDLQAFWQGKTLSVFPADSLFLDGSTKAIIEKIWGPASVNNVTVVSSEDLLNKTREIENAFAILPFEQLKPAWKVLALDGESPIQKHFNSSEYILNIPFSFLGDQTEIEALRLLLEKEGISVAFAPASNRIAEKLTTVVLTGVTALVRGTAYIMETHGLTYPAIDIGDILRDADILHISNEIPFAETCPSPFYNKANDANLIFCSKPEYIQLLEAIGTDVVELSGDHFKDWGSEAVLGTLDIYNARGWQYYGGGRDFNDGIQPALFNHNGNKIAFFGCNAKPPGYSTASATSPGAVHCDMDLMSEQVENAVEQGFLPIFTFQHTEYYSYKIIPALQADFHQAADAGAVIVSGSQAHQPHALEFYKNSFLHYGLGNLFFDQYGESFAQRQAFLDRHVFYEGAHISTELIPIMFIDLARPRLMTEEEKIFLLNNVFAASGW